MTGMYNQKIEVSKLYALTKRWLYIRALVLKDKTMVSQTPLERNTKYREQKKTTYPDKKEHKARIYLYHIYWYYSFIFAVSRCLSILNQTRIMTTIQNSTSINNRSKIKYFYRKYLILYFSNHLNER